MGLITSLAVGFVVFLVAQYLAPAGVSIWVSIFVAGFVAGLLAEGILKGLFVGLVISVIGVFIAVYFLGGIPGLGTNTKDIVSSLMSIMGGGMVILTAVAGTAGSALRKYKIKK